ncbi:predicted protein [Lichtheimia corymbifera JMRC:FSU:9682]|uniref:Uncharacterized protein n=1 Tax=Lichtheimia corymbifera JMRC:FSU:9682 TaxID=1263082 RepID=A0A068S3Z3_9FUNG|nr:predicted protein [Lichtheimia corymbifera JMRC:FSU:9682]
MHVSCGWIVSFNKQQHPYRRCHLKRNPRSGGSRYIAIRWTTCTSFVSISFPSPGGSGYRQLLGCTAAIKCLLWMDHVMNKQ